MTRNTTINKNNNTHNTKRYPQLVIIIQDDEEKKKITHNDTAKQGMSKSLMTPCSKKTKYDEEKKYSDSVAEK